LKKLNHLENLLHLIFTKFYDLLRYFTGFFAIEKLLCKVELVLDLTKVAVVDLELSPNSLSSIIVLGCFLKLNLGTGGFF
jgi:hypothetical protein